LTLDLMPELLTLDTWRAQLQARGHCLRECGRQTGTGFYVWPDPDTIITVAVEPDPVLKPQYRQRFFLCDVEPERVFRVMGCPEQYRNRWTELLWQQPPAYWTDFLAGPGAWLLSRLADLRQVVAWSDQGLAWDGLDCPTHREWGMEVPARAAPFFSPVDGPEACQPRLLAVDDGRFPDAVAACLLFASVGMQDCYLADAGAAEVYLAHHHDQIVVSIPDVSARENLLKQLQDAAWLFADVSGFASSTDDDEDTRDAP
jgi:hypothetical protein